MNKFSCVIPILIILLFVNPLSAHLLSAQSPYPEIKDLSFNSYLFRQLTGDVSRAYRSEAGNGSPPPLQLFRYYPKEDDTIFSISSRCSLPYESISSLNQLTSTDIRNKEMLLIPNRPGLFLVQNISSDLDILELARQVQDPPKETMDIMVFMEGKRGSYHFYPGRRYSSLQRAFFLGILFRLPLEKGVVSSSYGLRTHPFTGGHTFHHGIDLAAPRGSEVKPAREGIVTEKGFDPVLGNFIVISHEGNYETLYGHLDFSTVELKMTVGSDTIIGVVGSTGLSTGPHLHFEIRQGGKSRDPESLLPELKG